MTAARANQAIWVTSFMTCAYAVNTMNQAVVLVVAQQIKVDLSLSDAELGLILGLSFMLFSAIAAIPLGRIGDLFARHLVVGGLLTVMGVASALTAFVSQFLPLVLLRCMAGTADAGIMPSAASWIGDAAGPQRRTLALSVFNAGAAVGAFASYFGLGILAEAFGWRVAFLTVGILAVLVGLLVAFVLPPDARPVKPPTDRQFLLEHLQCLASNGAYRQIVLVFIAAGFTSAAGWGWVSPLLQRSYGFSLSEAGALLGVGFGIAMAAGSLVFGMVMTRFGGNRPSAKLWVALVMQASSATCLILALACDGLLLRGLIITALFFAGGGMVVVLETIQFVVPKELRSLAIGVALLLFSLFGQGLGPLATGVLSDTLGSIFGIDALRYVIQSCVGLGSVWVCIHLACTAFAVDRAAAKALFI